MSYETTFRRRRFRDLLAQNVPLLLRRRQRCRCWERCERVLEIWEKISFN